MNWGNPGPWCRWCRACQALERDLGDEVHSSPVDITLYELWHSEWEIEEPPMTFAEAVEAMDAGQTVERESIGQFSRRGSDGYEYWETNALRWLPTAFGYGAIRATDWRIVTENKPDESATAEPLRTLAERWYALARSHAQGQAHFRDGMQAFAAHVNATLLKDTPYELAWQTTGDLPNDRPTVNEAVWRLLDQEQKVDARSVGHTAFPTYFGWTEALKTLAEWKPAMFRKEDA
jgi:hypothetical protein